jgi:RES domain-containing protein
MIVYRYLKEKYLNDPLSGEGAKRVGGRWNSPGTSIIYASLSASTAQLEILASVADPDALSLFRLVCIELPDNFWKIDVASLVEVQEAKGSDKAWDSQIHPEYTREIGDLWAQEKDTIALMVPSSLCPLDYNVLINTEHPSFKEQVSVVVMPAYQISQRLLVKK